MATRLTTFNAASTPLSFKRMNPIPLDQTSHFDNYEEAIQYSHNDPTAYVGQLLVVSNPIGADQYEEKLYVIDNEAGDLREIGGLSETQIREIISESVDDTDYQSQIDDLENKIRAASGAMRLVGFISNQQQLQSLFDPETIEELSSSEENAGYTLRFAANLTYNGVAYKVGDLLTLFQGAWVHIPAGDELEATPISLELINSFLDNTDNYQIINGEIVDITDIGGGGGSGGVIVRPGR